MKLIHSVSRIVQARARVSSFWHWEPLRSALCFFLEAVSAEYCLVSHNSADLKERGATSIPLWIGPQFVGIRRNDRMSFEHLLPCPFTFPALGNTLNT